MSRFVLFVFLASSTSALARPEATPDPTPVEPVAEPAPEPAPAVVSAADVIAVEKTVEAPPKQAKLDLKPGGYLHVDGRRFVENNTGAHDFTVRRLRFKLDGSASKLIGFRTLVDFAGSRVQVLDAWAELRFHPALSLRAGKDKGQFGLERLQSATALTFVERGYPTQLAPNRDIGVWLRGDYAFLHYAVGVVGGTANNTVLEAETDDVLEYNAHVLVLPFKGNEKRFGDLAIGGAATFGRSKGTQTATGLAGVRTPGQLEFFKYATGMTVDSTAHTDGYRTRWTAHGYYYGGPFGVLAEYVLDREPVELGGSTEVLSHRAWQLAASVAVTPDDGPTYKGLKPKRAFDIEQGTWGAVELAARYSELRIDDDTFGSGMASGASSARRARTFTGGINWHLSEIVKLQTNYELTTFEGGAMAGNREAEHLVSTRLAASI